MQRCITEGRIVIGRWKGSQTTDVRAFRANLQAGFNACGRQGLFVFAVGDHRGHVVENPSPAMILDVLEIMRLCTRSHIVTVSGMPPVTPAQKLALRAAGVVRQAIESLPNMHDRIETAANSFLVDLAHADLLRSPDFERVLQRAKSELLLGEPLLKDDELRLLRTGADTLLRKAA